ncbi:aldehyde dehydrogenase family protein [uncultured Sphingomonas sp.]|uniref:aldehyde dehydrogenase family protein n=1 Tax=uncultured Sphingomonas sp. TaxID=158754 RepID=UPI0035CAD2BE
MSSATSYNLLIDGRGVATAHVAVLDPATGAVVGHAPVATAAQVDAAVAAAKAAYPGWAATSDDARKAACAAMADLIEAHAEELAQLLSREQGKPLGGFGARYEVGGAAAWARHAATLDLPVETIQDDADAHITLHRKPLGVVASITPWNWPLMIAIWHVVPAIRAGNTVVIKPSPFTPLGTLRLVEILQGALPPGVLNAVAGGDAIGPLLTGHPDIAKIVFTGSTATGRTVMGSAAATLKRVTLELGGNDAGIVLPDADPQAIAEGLFWGAFMNSGQTCAALKRLYVHDSLYDALCDALVTVARGVKLGNGLDDYSVLGPLQNRMQFDKVVRLVDQARADGARILTGGAPTRGPGYFYPVTLVADARDGMGLVDEEQFGPALPILRYTDLDDAIARANASENGLGASVWSADTATARAIGARLEAGTVWINRHGAIRPDTPFGGVKASGIGVEFGRQGLEEYTTIQVLHR